MTQLRVRPLTQQYTDQWNEFVTKHSRATIFHTLGWKRAIEDTFGYSSKYFLILNSHSDEVIGVFPAFETPSFVGSDITLPFCEYSYPLVSESYDKSSVLAKLKVETHRFDALISKERLDANCLGYNSCEFGGISTGVTDHLDVSRPFSKIAAQSFGNEARRGRSIASDHGISVVESDDVEEYYHLYLETMRRLGSPQFPRKFFEKLSDELGDSVTLLLARCDGRSIAGVIIFDFNDTYMIWSNASDKSFWEYKPNHLLYTEAIRLASQHVSTVDFGRSSPESGVHNFKQSFGGKTIPLASFVTPPRYTDRASIEQYKQLAHITKALSPVITHPAIGPRLKYWLHE